MDEKYFADDRFIIPEKIKKMSKEELDIEISRLEQEVKNKKRNGQKKDIAV